MNAPKANDEETIEHGSCALGIARYHGKVAQVFAAYGGKERGKKGGGGGGGGAPRG